MTFLVLPKFPDWKMPSSFSSPVGPMYSIDPNFMQNIHVDENLAF